MTFLGRNTKSASYDRWVRKYYIGQKGNYMPRRNKSYRGPGTKAYRGAARVVKLERKVKKLIKQQLGREFKYHDVEITPTTTTTGGVSYLTGIAQGDTSQTREGLQMNLHQIQCKMDFKTEGTNQIYQWRIVLAIDREYDGANPAFTDIFEGDEIYDYKEKHTNSRKRFKILYDKVITLNQLISGVPLGRYKEYFKRFKNPVKVNYLDTTAAAASGGANSLICAFVGNTAANHGTSTLNFRLRYTG